MPCNSCCISPTCVVIRLVLSSALSMVLCSRLSCIVIWMWLSCCRMVREYADSVPKWFLKGHSAKEANLFKADWEAWSQLPQHEKPEGEEEYPKWTMPEPTISDGYEHGAEWWDVTIRCYYLGQAIAAALDELEEAGAFDEADDTETAGSLDDIRDRMRDGFDGIAAAVSNTTTAPETATI